VTRPVVQVLRRALREYLVHYHAERNHQGKGNVLLYPVGTSSPPSLSLCQGGRCLPGTARRASQILLSGSRMNWLTTLGTYSCENGSRLETE